MQDRQRVTGFARLYQALRTLQIEIENLTADFEEQLSELVSSADPIEPPDELLILHRQLIALFTQYEQLSKRINGLPCQENGSQASVQSAIARSAAVFMTKEMVKLQAIQSLQKRSAEAKKKGLVISETTLGQLEKEGMASDAGSDVVEDVAIMLQPLLEQEAQLEWVLSCVE